MKVKNLIDMLQTYNPEHDVVISGHNGLELGFDLEVNLVEQYGWLTGHEMVMKNGRYTYK